MLDSVAKSGVHPVHTGTSYFGELCKDVEAQDLLSPLPKVHS